MITLLKSWEFILDIFFPPICLNCKKYLEEKEKPDLICGNCFQSIEIYKNLFRPSPQLILAAATSYGNSAAKELIHYFKYKGFLKAQKPLGKILVKYLENLNLDLKNYLIIPVPLYHSRLRKRGFNQAEILVEMVSKHFGWQPETRILKRIRETKPQIELPDYKARHKNLKNSFSVNEKLASGLKDKCVLLVDDVYTSGATIKEAAKILKKAGANKIIALVVAKAN